VVISVLARHRVWAISFLDEAMAACVRLPISTKSGSRKMRESSSMPQVYADHFGSQGCPFSNCTTIQIDGTLRNGCGWCMMRTTTETSESKPTNHRGAPGLTWTLAPNTEHHFCCVGTRQPGKSPWRASCATLRSAVAVSARRNRSPRRCRRSRLGKRKSVAR